MASQSPSRWSKDFVEHVRAVHFALIIVSAALAVTYWETHNGDISLAIRQANGIADVAKDWPKTVDKMLHDQLIAEHPNDPGLASASGYRLTVHGTPSDTFDGKKLWGVAGTSIDVKINPVPDGDDFLRSFNWQFKDPPKNLRDYREFWYSLHNGIQVVLPDLSQVGCDHSLSPTLLQYPAQQILAAAAKQNIEWPPPQYKLSCSVSMIHAPAAPPGLVDTGVSISGGNEQNQSSTPVYDCPRDGVTYERSQPDPTGGSFVSINLMAGEDPLSLPSKPCKGLGAFRYGVPAFGPVDPQYGPIVQFTITAPAKLYQIGVGRDRKDFDAAFSDLAHFSYSRDTLPFPDLISQLNEISKHPDASPVEVLGLTIPADEVSSWGLAFLSCLQLYFWLHLHEASKRICPEDEGWSTAWIGIYQSKISLGASVISATALPVAVSFMLAHSAVSR